MDILGRFQTACVNRAWHADNQYDEATVPEFISLRNEIRPSEKIFILRLSFYWERIMPVFLFGCLFSLVWSSAFVAGKVSIDYVLPLNFLFFALCRPACCCWRCGLG